MNKLKLRKKAMTPDTVPLSAVSASMLWFGTLANLNLLLKLVKMLLAVLELLLVVLKLCDYLLKPELQVSLFVLVLEFEMLL